MDTEILINDFATRSFRDIADYDYIAARLSYRAKLFPQFMWSGLQAIEKYLKCILLLNRIVAKNVNHSLGIALDLATNGLPFELRLREPSRKIIEHLDKFGKYRYFESSYYVRDFELPKLDMAVWDIRRYCEALDYSITLSDGKKKRLFEENISRIVAAENKPPQQFRIIGGQLEKILDNKKHPGREALIWHNLFFGSRVRQKIRPSRYMAGASSPLTLHPEALDAVLSYVFIPKDVVAAYREASISASENSKQTS